MPRGLRGFLSAKVNIVASKVLFADELLRQKSYSIGAKCRQGDAANESEQYGDWATIAHFIACLWKQSCAAGVCLDTEIFTVHPAQSSSKAHFREVILWIRWRAALQLSFWRWGTGNLLFKLWPEQKVYDTKSDERDTKQQLFHGFYYITWRVA